MTNFSQLNYDENSSFAKHFHNEGDDVLQLYSSTRQRVQALRSEWMGEAAEAFYEQMEASLLPALQKLSGALFTGEEVLNKIMKIIHEADEEAAGYFKSALDGDFGAGMFGAALGEAGIPGGSTSGADFGASTFESALGDQPGVETGPGGTGGEPVDGFVPKDTPSAPEISKADYAELLGQSPDSESAETAETPPATETAGAGGGGGGGGEGGQGLSGDLKGLGTGVGGQPQQVSSAGAGAPEMPDHIFGGSSESTGGGDSAPAGPAGGAGSPQEGSTGGGVAAGVAGAAGAAAAGGVAKVLKDQSDQTGQ